jgi:hypothetical protein
LCSAKHVQAATVYRGYDKFKRDFQHAVSGFLSLDLSNTLKSIRKVVGKKGNVSGSILSIERFAENLDKLSKPEQE